MKIEFFKKRKQRELELKRREGLLDDAVVHTIRVQEANTDIQKSTLDIAAKSQNLGEELKILVLENEKTKNLLLARENLIKDTLEKIEERQQTVRKEEIYLEAKKSDLRNKEQLLNQKLSEIEKEKIEIKNRERVSDEAKKKAQEETEKYEALSRDLEEQKNSLKDQEEAALRREEETNRLNKEAKAIHKKAEGLDAEMKKREQIFEKERLKIEAALKEKLEEVDRRLADLDNVKGIVDDIKYDESEDGKSAKIVVKEAIRKAKNMLVDISKEFELLDEKYCTGTFKGFSTPIAEIDKCYTELKDQYQQIKDHIAHSEGLPSSVSKWLETIEEYILKADTGIKSWEFSEAYRYITYGLSTCKNYELLLQILNAWASGENSEEPGAVQPEENFTT